MYKRLLLVLLGTALVPALVLGACRSGDDDDTGTPAVTRTATQPATASTSATATTGAYKLENGTVTPSGLQFRDDVVGTGATPRLDQQVTVHYKGTLAATGQQFDSSYDRGQPATFSLQRVIKGFAEGISTMKVGGKRTVYIPANLGYANNPPDGSIIPKGADLIFEIELLAIK